MSRIAADITELIGHTPLVELRKYSEKYGLKARLVAKLESFNPMSSAKDRVALEMIEEGMKNGTIHEDTIIVEPTSGNTGIGLACVCASKGLKLILTMPETMSIERRKIVAALGAEVILTEASKGMAGAIEKANEIVATNPNVILAGQFDNQANPEAHRKTTALEIYEDTDGEVDVFIATVGTGGTITGVGEVLKQKKPSVRVVGVEPLGSPVLNGGKAGAHKIQGIGAGFIPKVLNCEIMDEIIDVKDEMAYEKAREIAKLEGIMVGISSGAGLYAATLEAMKPENEGKTIVVLFTDSGERYLSTDLY